MAALQFKLLAAGIAELDVACVTLLVLQHREVLEQQLQLHPQRHTLSQSASELLMSAMLHISTEPAMISCQ